MKSLMDYQFIPTESFCESLKQHFRDEYQSQEKKPLIGKEDYTNKKTNEFCQTLTEAHRQILAGLEAFINRTTKDFPTDALFKHFSKIAALTPEECEAQTIKQLLEISDADYVKLYNLAAVELNNKNFTDASHMFLLLCWLNPNVYTPLLGLGLAEAQLGNRTKAQEIYEQCIPLGKEDPYVYLYLAENCHKLGDKSKCKGFLDEAKMLATKKNDKVCLELIGKINI